jgi:hypothetical protein
LKLDNEHNWRDPYKHSMSKVMFTLIMSTIFI